MLMWFNTECSKCERKIKRAHKQTISVCNNRRWDSNKSGKRRLFLPPLQFGSGSCRCGAKLRVTLFSRGKLGQWQAVIFFFLPADPFTAEVGSCWRSFVPAHVKRGHVSLCMTLLVQNRNKGTDFSSMLSLNMSYFSLAWCQKYSYLLPELIWFSQTANYLFLLLPLPLFKVKRIHYI